MPVLVSGKHLTRLSLPFPSNVFSFFPTSSPFSIPRKSPLVDRGETLGEALLPQLPRQSLEVKTRTISQLTNHPILLILLRIHKVRDSADLLPVLRESAYDEEDV